MSHYLVSGMPVGTKKVEVVDFGLTTVPFTAEDIDKAKQTVTSIPTVKGTISINRFGEVTLPEVSRVRVMNAQGQKEELVFSCDTASFRLRTNYTYVIVDFAGQFEISRISE